MRKIFLLIDYRIKLYILSEFSFDLMTVDYSINYKL